jgi:hypothetical protein
MKKLLVRSALLIFACSSDDSEDTPLPAYTGEGKWLWSPVSKSKLLYFLFIIFFERE